VKILVEKLEISEHRPVFSSQFELFEKEQVEFLVVLVHDRYRLIILFCPKSTPATKNSGTGG
jgi:hypothetical protein